MTATNPTIDLTRIKFPTDKLTVRMLRKAYPAAFDVEPPPNPILDENRQRPLRRQSLDAVLACVVDSERILAEMAFKAALGRVVLDDDRQGGRETIIYDLSGDYVAFGLARGDHEAQEMLRSIEAQAAAQARQHGDRPR
jgi:hypothetical protein